MEVTDSLWRPLKGKAERKRRRRYVSYWYDIRGSLNVMSHSAEVVELQKQSCLLVREWSLFIYRGSLAEFRQQTSFILIRFKHGSATGYSKKWIRHHRSGCVQPEALRTEFERGERIHKVHLDWSDTDT